MTTDYKERKAKERYERLLVILDNFRNDSYNKYEAVAVIEMVFAEERDELMGEKEKSDDLLVEQTADVTARHLIRIAGEMMLDHSQRSVQDLRTATYDAAYNNALVDFISEVRNKYEIPDLPLTP